MQTVVGKSGVSKRLSEGMTMTAVSTINVGSADRLARIILGLVLVVLPFVTSFGLWVNPIAAFGVPIVGVVLIVTALFRFCPAYRLFGIRTCKVG